VSCRGTLNICMKYSVFGHMREALITPLQVQEKQIGISRLLKNKFSRELHEIHYLNLADVNKD
jgi:hypothetical protein